MKKIRVGPFGLDWGRRKTPHKLKLQGRSKFGTDAVKMDTFVEKNNNGIVGSHIFCVHYLL